MAPILVIARQQLLEFLVLVMLFNLISQIIVLIAHMYDLLVEVAQLVAEIQFTQTVEHLPEVAPGDAAWCIATQGVNAFEHIEPSRLASSVVIRNRSAFLTSAARHPSLLRAVPACIPLRDPSLVLSLPRAALRQLDQLDLGWPTYPARVSQDQPGNFQALQCSQESPAGNAEFR
jgi:hypothetical protein